MAENLNRLITLIAAKYSEYETAQLVTRVVGSGRGILPLASMAAL